MVVDGGGMRRFRAVQAARAESGIKYCDCKMTWMCMLHDWKLF